MKRAAYVVGVIPARYGSRRLRAKPLIDLRGKPMVQRVYEQAVKAKLLDRVVVATDDKRIAGVVGQFWGEVFMTSPRIKSGSDRVAEVSKKIKGDIYVNIQGDEPLIEPRMIDQAVGLLLRDPKSSIGTLVRKIESVEELLSPGVVKVVLSKDSNGIYFSRSPIPYVRDERNARRWLKRSTFYKHIGLYVFRRNFLQKYAAMMPTRLEQTEQLEQLRILENGYKIKVGITKYDNVPVDTSRDVKNVLRIMKAKKIT